MEIKGFCVYVFAYVYICRFIKCFILMSLEKLKNFYKLYVNIIFLSKSKNI